MVKFYICNHCGNIIRKVKDSKVSVFCCGEEMEELIPKTADVINEKHVPVIDVNDLLVKVTVGSALHPMIEEHYIEWICLETDKGIYFKNLYPNSEPIALFNVLDNEKVLTAYEYCSLHGLWKNEL